MHENDKSGASLLNRITGMSLRQSTALVLGGGGFIGSHMVKRLKSEGFWVRAVDLKHPEFSVSPADEFVLGDLTDRTIVRTVLELRRNDRNMSGAASGVVTFDEVYQFAADMGGAGYIYAGEHDASIMHDSVSINLNVLEEQRLANEQTGYRETKIFYASSACVYPAYMQQQVDNPGLRERDAYPGDPDSEYGWEKLFSERLYVAYGREHGIPVRIARYHNVYGPEAVWEGGREKAPAALCRKVARAGSNGTVECWGDGEQTRSFLYIDDCIEATRRLMRSSCTEVINIGSDEMVSINHLIDIVARAAGYKINVTHINGPLGVRGRNSCNDRIRELLDWNHKVYLREGIQRTYAWIKQQIASKESIQSFG